MKQTLNKSVYLKHSEVLIILGLIESHMREIEKGDYNIVEQFMLDMIFLDITIKLDPHNQETIQGIITKPTPEHTNKVLEVLKQNK
jgi:hypothetical protein